MKVCFSWNFIGVIMNRGKEPPMSLCERRFVLEAIKESKRLDGRETYDYRDITISLGKEPGHVEVTLGGTRVFACVTCQVSQPRPQRPTDGQLFFNVELSPMASPAFEVGKPSSRATEITRILERCLKDSRAIDTESLCIIAGEKVWDIRIDIHVLDYCGNIIDCAAIAAISALKHFRRPDVTVVGESATIHPVTEREPVPLSVHHMPLCFTFAFFSDGEYLVVDPSRSEEAVMDGNMIIGMNIHREICVLQMTSGVAILPEQVLRCTQIAAVKCAEVTQIIKRALSGKATKPKESSTILQTKRAKEEVAVPEVDVAMEEEKEEDEEMEANEKPQITHLGEGTAELGAGGPNTWELVDVWNSVTEEGEDNETEQPSKDEKRVDPSNQQTKDLDSEEEDTVVLKTQFGSEASDVKEKTESKSPSEAKIEEGGEPDAAAEPAASSGKKKRGRRGKRGSKQEVMSSEASQTNKASNDSQPTQTTGTGRARRIKRTKK